MEGQGSLEEANWKNLHLILNNKAKASRNASLFI